MASRWDLIWPMTGGCNLYGCWCRLVAGRVYLDRGCRWLLLMGHRRLSTLHGVLLLRARVLMLLSRVLRLNGRLNQMLLRRLCRRLLLLSRLLLT